MDIYDFFNSPDVAEHCRSIGHKLNAIEAAVMINKSDKHTLSEKHAAYKAIIAEYPDMEIPESLHCGHIKSFHAELAKQISHDELLIEKFLTSEAGAVFQVSVLHSGRNSNNHTSEKLFANYNDAVADMKEYLKYVEEPITTMTVLPRIKKIYIGSDEWMHPEVSPQGEIIRFEWVWMPKQELGTSNYCVFDEDSQDRRKGTFDFLESFLIHVPVPFKPSDLVENSSINCMEMGNVYVLQDTAYGRNVGSDTSDMTAYAYYVSENGSVECECMHFYPDLRYCRRELEGDARILEYVSLFIQDKLCLCNLLRIQRYLVGDKITSNIETNEYRFRESQLEHIVKKLVRQRTMLKC